MDGGCVVGKNKWLQGRYVVGRDEAHGAAAARERAREQPAVLLSGAVDLRPKRARAAPRVRSVKSLAGRAPSRLAGCLRS